MDELQERKRLFSSKKELANFFHADIFNVTLPEPENGHNGTYTPSMRHQACKNIIYSNIQGDGVTQLTLLIQKHQF